MAVKHEQCPRCAQVGRDMSQDNLAVYEDGHAYCFACQYHRPATLLLRAKALIQEPEIKAAPELNFPKDYTTDLPQAPMAWLRSYMISTWEIEKWKIGWSESLSSLIYPVFGEEGQLVAWQERDFSDRGKRAKYLTHGPITGTITLTGTDKKNHNVLIVTEDLLSAIKVGRCYQTMPLWGCNLPMETVRKLSKRFEGLGIWLDKDKSTEALITALRASQFMPSFVVHSSLDPKEYNTEMIAEFVDIAGREVLFGGEPVQEVEEDIPTPASVDPTDAIDYIANLCKTRSYEEVRHMYPKYNLSYQDYLNKKTGLTNVVVHNPTNKAKIESDDPHDPEPGERYLDWCHRLCVTPNTPAFFMFIEKSNALLEKKLDKA